MRHVLSWNRCRAAVLAAVCGLAFGQTACAHPVVVESAVVVPSHMGGPGYAPPLYGAPIVVTPAPMLLEQRITPLQEHHHHGGHRHRHGHGHGHDRDHDRDWGRRAW